MLALITSLGKAMAKFNKNTLQQVSGFDNQIIAGELVYNQSTYWNITLDSEDLPIDLTGATIDASIIRRQLSNIRDSRYGLTFDIADYTPTPSAVPLTITNRINATGKFTLIIDDAAWGVIASDPQLDINAENCVGFSGRIKISFPAVGSNPAQDLIVFLLFLVRSDGVIN
jgi:hypothetical protein